MTIFGRALLAGFCVVCLTNGAIAQETALSPEELRSYAYELADAGDPIRAAALAQALLSRDPKDVAALMLLAQIAAHVARLPDALAYAARAYAAAETDEDSFLAASLAAGAHAAMAQDTRAQLWLRRARQYAPTPEAATIVAENYQVLRDRNPLSLRLRFGFTPSDNVNGGSVNATTQLPDVDNGFLAQLYFWGIYNPETGEIYLGDNQRALSGVTLSFGAGATYRLRETRDSQTLIDGSLDLSTVWLSPGAREKAPGTKGRDFGSGTVGFGLTHRWVTDATDLPWRLRLDLERRFALDGSSGWRLDSDTNDSLTIGTEVEHGRMLGDRDRLTYQLRLQQQRFEPDSKNALEASIDLGWVHLFGNDTRLSLNMGLAESRSDNVDNDFRSISLSAGYDLGAPLPGVGISLGGFYEDQTYAETVWGPDERHDRISVAALNLTFENFEYYGFQPVLTLRGTRVDSNIKQFQRDAVGISFDLQSAF